MSLLKNKVFAGAFIVVLAAFAFVLNTSTAEAATCTSQSSGDWHTVARWGGCGGVLPQSTDDVVIATAHAITMSGSATVASLTFNDAVAAANSLTVGSGNTLTVSGATTYTATTGAAGSTLAVGAGTFTTDTLVINDGAAGGDMVLSVSTGTINVTGNVSGTWTNAADVQFTSTGDSDMNFGGNFPGGATLDGTGGTITFNGSGSKTIGAYITYNNVVINKPGGTMTMVGAVQILGNFTLTAGTLETAGINFTVNGNSSITGTLTTTAGGTKTFTGNVTLNSGAVWSETGSSAFVFGGNFTNNATTFTASTGLHTMGGASKVMSGDTTTAIPSLRITGATSNTGTLTVATLLDVADATTFTNTGTVTATTALSDVGTTGVFVNGAAGTLNLGGVSDISTLTATAAGNTVNYTKAGAQTVFDPGTATDYYHLGLSGSGAKSIAAATVIAGNLTIGGTATATLADSISTADKLYYGTTLQRAGTYGAAASSATNKSDTYFTAAVNQLITIATGRTNNTNNSGGSTSTICGSAYTLKNGACVANTTSTITTTDDDEEVADEEDDDVPAVVECAAGQTFNPMTGKKCGSVIPTSNAQGNAYAFGQTTIKMGSKGEACTAWQNFLNAKSNAGLVTDGWCGKLTIGAAKSWQASMGLTPDGLLGPMSRAKAATQ